MDIKADFNFERQQPIEATFELNVVHHSLDLQDYDNSSTLFQSLSEVQDLISEAYNDIDEVSQDVNNRLADLQNQINSLIQRVEKLEKQ